jgi:predicted ATPase
LMIVTYRPEFAPFWIGGAQVTSLALSRLGWRETTTLIDRVPRGRALPPAIRTDGIPLFIEGLTKALLEGALLWRDAIFLPVRCYSWRSRRACGTCLMARLDRWLQ